MSIIDWSDRLSVNIDEIDTQHQKLITMINRLNNAVEDGDWSHKIVTMTDILLGLIDYLEYHFSTEEKYMIDYQYPEYQAHCEAHRDFVHEVTAFTEAFRNGTKGLSNEILSFLKEWYVQHITDIDMKFGAFLQTKGLS